MRIIDRKPPKKIHKGLYVNKGGRPAGRSCDFLYDTTEIGSGCRKSARVVIFQNISGHTHVTYRCWAHYLVLENSMRKAREGLGNILIAKEVKLGEDN